MLALTLSSPLLAALYSLLDGRQIPKRRLLARPACGFSCGLNIFSGFGRGDGFGAHGEERAD